MLFACMYLHLELHSKILIETKLHGLYDKLLSFAYEFREESYLVPNLLKQMRIYVCSRKKVLCLTLSDVVDGLAILAFHNAAVRGNATTYHFSFLGKEDG